MRTLLTIYLMLIAFSSAGEETFSSGPERVSVVELYTSEGCSSCPPADAWLSKFKTDEALFKSVIPLAFHVDYWDYLGWRDEFSDPRHSERQRLYHQLGHSASVYTPGFIVNGEEWRGFFGRDRNRLLARNSVSKPGILELHGAGQNYTATFRSQASASQYLVVHLAYLGTGLSNRIKRGENAGRQLDHDFVVLATKQQAMSLKDGVYVAELPRVAIKDATAVAAWISERADPTPIQAVGGYLAVHQASQ